MRTYYNDIVNENQGNQKVLYKVAGKLFHKSSDPVYPAHDNREDLCNRFADFFEDRIKSIRQDLEELRESCPQMDDSYQCKSTFSEFSALSEDKVDKLIRSSATKSCPLDPVPTPVVKTCLSVLLPCFTRIINLSLTSGVMPDVLKEALLSPQLKKVLLDPEILKHFRPISNLPYVAKLVETTAIHQVSEYAIENDLLEILQSAYKQYHSTETALIKVHNDVMIKLDGGESIILMLLDATAAFDTVDHAILLHRLETYLGITGTALEWFRSYLAGRSQTVIIEGSSSTKRTLHYGVPQGSVVGPFLFVVYTLPLGAIMRKYGVYFHIYADDTQLYISFKIRDPNPTNEKLENLVKEIQQWFTINFLKLNGPKTDMMIAYVKHRPPVYFPPIRVDDEYITASDTVRNLGVLFDSTMSMDAQIKAVTSVSFATLRDMYKARDCLTTDATKALVQAFVTSRLDYCNFLYYGLPQKQTKKLQAVQNTSARLISRTLKYDHITPVLKELHWLPISGQYRSIYKILLITYKCLHGIAPVYLIDLLEKRPSRGLRSDNTMTLVVPKSKLVTYGDRAFSVAAPKLWNSLPVDIRLCDNVAKFKRALKTHLFRKAYC